MRARTAPTLRAAPALPLRLCVITNTVDVGGAETQLLRLCRAIAPEQAQITVLYYGGQHRLRAEFDATPARVVFFDREAIGRARFVLSLARYLRQQRFGVVHCWHGTANQYGGAAAALARCPIIVTGYRDFRAEPWPFRTVDRFIRPFTAGRMVNSFAIRTKHSVTSAYPINRIHVVHNGLDPAEFANLPDADQTRRDLGFDASRPLLMTVGRLDEIKEQHVFVSAAKRIIDAGADWQFAIVGDGPQRSALHSLARNLGIEGRIRFLGERRDVPAVLRTANLSVCTSRSEGLPNVVLESMMVGTPVITTDNGGGPELVPDPEQVVPVGDARAVAELALAAVANPETLARWAATGKRRAQEQFTVEAASRKYLALLDELSAGRLRGSESKRPADREGVA